MHDGDDDPLWFKDAVIYELHVRAFQDANDDGIGDFAGLTSRLDYLQDLGVTALWLLPFYPSPGRDDGYDIADYRTINPDYGTMRQFSRFVKEAHARGLRVITELVLNHTSDQHAWFQRAVRAPKGSAERDFYVWSDTPDRFSDVRVIFEDYETSNWQWHGEAGQYYWHRFFHHQPDLNFDSPAVRRAVTGVLDHWAALGVDGMRLDAIPYLFVREGTNGENLPETHAFLKQLRRHLDARHPGRMLLAEANQWPEDAAAYFGDGDECHMSFHFPLMPRLYMAVAMEDRFPVVDILQQTPAIPDTAQWGVFLRNHDELTLEMVTDEERDSMYRAYARERAMRVNLGIRRRLAPLLGGDRRLIELMNSLLFSLPGTPIVYYGDELGMGDNVYLGDRDSVRTPMQWSADRNAGFSRANPQRLYLPVIVDPDHHYAAVNVEAQQANPRSLLWWMKRLIALRRRHRVLGRGELELLAPDNPKVLAYVRSWTPPDADDAERVLVVANLSRHAQPCELDLSDDAGCHPVELFGRTSFPPITDRPYVLTLGPYQYLWLSLERDPAHLLLPRAGDDPPQHPDDAPVVLSVTGAWTALLRRPGRERLEAALPDVLVRQRWFGGKARALREVRLAEVLPVGPKGDPTLHVLLLEVDYVDGDPEEYVLPVVFAPTDGGGPAGTVLAHIEGRGPRGQSGVLLDALTDPAACRALLELVARRRRVGSADAALAGRRRPGLPSASALAALEPRPLRAEQSNTSIAHGDQVLVKVLRRIEDGQNPDVELGDALRHLPHVPDVLGTLELERDASTRTATLAIVQRFVVNEGDAWSATLDELGRFSERVVTQPLDARPAPAAGRPPLDLALAGVPEAVHAEAGPYLATLQLLGRRVAELHGALAGLAGDPDLVPEPLARLSQRSLYQSLRTAVRLQLRTARRDARTLPDELRAQVLALAEREHELLTRLTELTSAPIDAVRTRIHGDLHLGQALLTGRDVVLIDFEGEPSKPLSERRLKRLPLRDVAGLLRSLQYATATTLVDQVERGLVTPGQGNHQQLAAWLDWWLAWGSATLLQGYLDAADGQGVLPAELAHTRLLLDAFQLEKAVYELGYEMNNRPTWTWIPLAAISTLLGDAP